MTRLSILDRSLVRQGQSPAQALRDTVRFARQAEELGYHRFWVAEHHSVPGVAGAAPTVLASAIAAATSRIRVGTGGVMVPNHRPLVVAEQFGVLGSLHPGRIDMGLGRSLGFTGGIRKALGVEDADDFDARLKELLGYFSGGLQGVHAYAAEGSRPEVFTLAVGAGASVAAEHGLPLVIGGPRVREGVERYRAEFRPSAWAAEPYVVVAANVAVGSSRLHVPEAWATAHSRTRGFFPPLQPADEVLAMEMTPRERALFEESLKGHISGTKEEVDLALRSLVDLTRADEVLVTMNTFDLDERLESYRQLINPTIVGNSVP